MNCAQKHCIRLTIGTNDSNIMANSKSEKMKTQVKKVRFASHRALFDASLPFRARVERDRTQYTRKQKHRKNSDA
jgi:stalled ribosome alternative rescue factor ArfA